MAISKYVVFTTQDKITVEADEISMSEHAVKFNLLDKDGEFKETVAVVPLHCLVHVCKIANFNYLSPDDLKKSTTPKS